MMIHWRNLREGADYLRVSLCGRFLIQRSERTESPEKIEFRYEVTDLQEGQTLMVGTLQAACQQAEAWRCGPS